MRHWEIPRSAMGTRHLVEAALERGMSAEACLSGTGMRFRDLAVGDATVAAWQEVMTAANLAGFAHGDEGVGLELGRRLPLAVYGVTGAALRAARSTTDVVEITRRYAALLPGLTRVTGGTEAGGATVTVTFEGRRLAGPGRRLLVERDLSAGHLALTELIGRAVPLTRLEVPRLPDDPAPWVAQFGLTPGPATPGLARMHIDARHFDGRFPGGALPALRAAMTECQQALVARRSQATAAHLVMVRLWSAAPDLPDLETLATSLLTTSRTLRRRLAEEGTSYQKLRDQVRLRIATQLLDDRDHAVKDVATLLGYADTPAFTNAFRRWTGQGPRAWRAAHATHDQIWSASLSVRRSDERRGTGPSWRTA